MTLNFLDIAIKLALGVLALVVVINLTGKGNLAPASASDQVQNYVLGGIIGGVIYNPGISILQFLIILMIWLVLVLSFKWLKTHNQLLKKTIDGEPTDLISLNIVVYGEENPKYPLITDGHIQYKTLDSIDKTEEWLMQAIAEAGQEDVAKIFLAEYIDGNITIVEY